MLSNQQLEEYEVEEGVEEVEEYIENVHILEPMHMFDDNLSDLQTSKMDQTHAYLLTENNWIKASNLLYDIENKQLRKNNELLQIQLNKANQEIDTGFEQNEMLAFDLECNERTIHNLTQMLALLNQTKQELKEKYELGDIAKSRKITSEEL